jgi:hypothetical protein
LKDYELSIRVIDFLANEEVVNERLSLRAKKMSLVDDKSATFNSVNFGPTFGAGADLAICHNGNV